MEVEEFIKEPHAHDVLCGRGGKTNLHVGNAWFRKLVRSNQELYMACPKGTKLLVAKAVVKAIEDQKPPGRFLEPDPRPDYSNFWRVVTSRKAVDKTSQALREPPWKKSDESPTCFKELRVSIPREQQRPKKSKKKKERKRKTKAELFERPDWWSSGTPVASAAFGQVVVIDELEPKAKRVKPAETEEDDVVPLPVESMQTRQSSFFNFLRSNRLFSTVSPSRSSIVGDSIQSNPLANPSKTNTQTNVMGTANFEQMGIKNAPETDDFEPLPLHSSGLQDTQAARQAIQMLQNQGEFLATQEFAEGKNNLNAESTVPLAIQMLQNQGGFLGTQEFAQETNNLNAEPTVPIATAAAPPPNAGLKAQVSDWLNSFLPRNIENNKQKKAPVSEAPSPLADNLERSISSTFLNFARSPSQILTNLKSGVTAFFVDSEQTPGSTSPDEGFPQPITVPKPSLMSQTHSFGTPSVAKKDDLLEDTDETPLEMQFRRVFSSKS